jgi:capsular exopolysaccharide synthesis family protein
LLRSRTLARRVIDQIGLSTIEDNEADEPSFASQAKAAIKDLFATLSGATGEEGPDLVDPELAQRMEEEDLFLDSLTIDPVPDSRLVRVSFESPSPEEAAAVANAIAANFISMNLERRYDASSYAKEFLQDQLDQMRVTLEGSERRFVAYAREREIVNLDDRLETILSKLRSMSDTLVRAEAERFAAEAAWQEFQEATDGGTPGVQNSEVIQSLKKRLSELQATYEENLQVYKPGYPKMQQLQSQIDELRAEVNRETGSIASSVKAQYEAKLREERSIRQRLSELKDEALALQDRSTDYETLRREVETNRELYDGLLQRMKEVGVAAGVGENNISVVDAAQVPLAPYKPNLSKNLAIAIALGLFCGVGLAFLLEMLDDSIKASDDVERRVGAPVLSLVPFASAREHGLSNAEVPLIAFRDPKSAVAEAVRSLRTSLLFSTSEGAPKILHFTSASPTEGKTTTAVSTAIAFAQSGGKVLMIDGDLRNPSLHRVFSLPNVQGLTNHLAGDADPVEIAQPTLVKNLFTITSGPLPPNPVELLSTPKMADLLSLAVERFDHVIIDGPPVIGLADALVLANLSRATIFVAEPGSSRKHDIDGAIRRLQQANARVIGAVLTKVGRSGQGYGYGYSYGYSYNYLYSYGGKSREPKLPEQADA